MIAELMTLDWWWLLPLVGISFGQQESRGEQSAQSSSRSRGESFATGESGSAGRSLTTSASQTGIGARLRPQLENLVSSLTDRFNASPLLSSILNLGAPQVPALNPSGLFPAQEAILPEIVRLATAPISAGMAARGMVSPENTREVGGSVATAIAPQLLPIISKNIADAALLPGQAMTAATSPFTNLIASLTALLGGTTTGTGVSTTDSFSRQLAQALQEAESQATSTGSQRADAWNVGLLSNLSSLGGKTGTG